ncbi:2'-5' RNA ligase family protein [Marinomonas sp. C2222]|uniref:2'-5' RNA ligase family protein n=1 Tax=Marinomonas sargassi TaxID=2984494 RepID=A0ABT2YU24_9GAMM|nr:2'-5' RNA ligase family protein [Marinomonas sargassi]MCV2403265.1 2'-5' RNA ligase family protein [Marinomonas sargassi]
MIINKLTYLIAELEGEVEGFVLNFRKRFNPERVTWPTDITIAGSSGIGTLSEGQDLDFVIAEIAVVLDRYSFNDVTFESLERFPDTGIYILKPSREKFDELHNAIKETQVKFNDTPWPFTPHCTLSAVQENSEDLEEVFVGARYPIAAKIRSFSLYQPETNGGCRIHRF